MSTATGDAPPKHAEAAYSTDSTSQNPPDVTHLNAPVSKWRNYVHLYLPIAVSVVMVFHAEGIAQTLGFSEFDRGNTLPVILVSAIPTYMLGSTIYPRNRPDPLPEQSIRFTRKNDIYRALVLLTYGRLFGTAFNLLFFGIDVFCSFAADALISERPAGTPQRRSEFFVALLWVTGSLVLQQIVPFSTPIIGILLGAADRTLWRTAYVALVDDVVGVLTRPDVRTWKGTGTLVLVQAFTITSLNYLARSFIRRSLAVVLENGGTSADA